MMRTAQLFLVAGLAAAVGLEIHAAADVVNLWAVWTAAPFALLLWATLSRWLRPVSAPVFLVAALLFGLSAIFAYRPASIASRSTAGLVFLFLPLWQLAAGIAVIVVAHLLGRDRRTSR